MSEPVAEGGAATGQVERHKVGDRAYHWTMALSVLILVGTGLSPMLEIKFAWVTIHWVAGVVLTAAVGVHMVRAPLFQDWRAMVIDIADIRNAWCSLRLALGRTGPEPGKPGKYPILQKVYHLGAAVIVLLATVTGLLMLAKLDTPFWKRDPYIFSDGTWGVIYVLHGLAALSVITLIMVHIYFAVRPEKLWMTRSMFVGWITRAEYDDHFDPTRWASDGDGPQAPGS